MRTAAALLLWLCGPVMAQSTSPTVLVDAVVTDQADAPIHGLTAADFHIFLDGKERPVAGVRTQAGPQRVVLLFGPQSPDAQQWIQQAVAKFVTANTSPNRLVSIVFTDVCYGTRSTPFFQEPDRIQQALTAWPDLLHCEHPADPSGDLRAAYYAQVGQSLARLPGHKTVVLFVATAGPTAAADGNKPPEAAPATRKGRARSQEKAEPHQDPFDMEREFRKADASVYPVQAQVGAGLPSWALFLAAASGGRALTGNDSASVLESLSREQDESYTLTFSPGPSPEGSCHELKVAVNRPDAKVLGRNLYCNVSEASTTAAVRPRSTELESLAASDTEGSTAASASVPFFYGLNGVARVNLALEIPSPVLEPSDLNGKLHAEMEVLGVAYARPSGVVAAQFTDKMKFDFDTRQQFDDFLRRPIHFEHQFEAAPGDYVFKVVFRSGKDRFGAAEAPLTIDPFHAAQLSLSAIALSRNVQPMSREAVQDEVESGKIPLIFRGNRITVSGSDVLSRTGTAEAYFEIYRPPATGDGAIQLTARLRLLDAQTNQERWNSGDVDLSVLAKPGDRVIPVAIRLPVAGLPPGAFRAELTVKDSAGGKATRSINLRTE